MASPTPAPPPPPRASFNSLPTEIKAQIVKLAKEQDKNYRARNEKATKKEKSAAQALKRGWHGRSTNALFLVNKELSVLAEPFVFEMRCVCRSGKSFEELIPGSFLAGPPSERLPRELVPPLHSTPPLPSLSAHRPGRKRERG